MHIRHHSVVVDQLHHSYTSLKLWRSKAYPWAGVLQSKLITVWRDFFKKDCRSQRQIPARWESLKRQLITVWCYANPSQVGTGGRSKERQRPPRKSVVVPSPPLLSCIVTFTVFVCEKRFIKWLSVAKPRVSEVSPSPPLLDSDVSSSSPLLSATL